MGSKLAEKYIATMNKMPITEIQIGDNVYLDIRIYTDKWVETLNLYDAFTKKYVVRATYTNRNQQKLLP